MKPFLTVIALSCSFINMALAATSDKCNQKSQISTMSGFAVGDGIADDTAALQERLTYCSTNGYTCVIPANANHRINDVLYLWGDACLVGPGKISFDIDLISEPYLLNIGISGRSNGSVANNKIKPAFSGEISDVEFNIFESDTDLQNTELGRIIYFWRTDGARIDGNRFEIGNYKYSATTSGNHNLWLSGENNYIRKNILISNNIILASSDNNGSEGIGLGRFDGATISGNRIEGVGDDPIGIHWSKNIIIRDNILTSIDGRIYLSNPQDIEVFNNKHTRIAGIGNNYYSGISLIYVGFEDSGSSSERAPTNLHIHHNELIYGNGAVDAGSAIYVYGARNITIEYNYIQNDSPSLVNSTASVYILPKKFSTTWNDPDFLDTNNTARVHQITIRGNTSLGLHPLWMKMTGDCIDYDNPVSNVVVQRNVAPSYQFYCGISTTTNHTLNSAM